MTGDCKLTPYEREEFEAAAAAAAKSDPYLFSLDRRHRELSPVQKLALAVLARGILDYHFRSRLGTGSVGQRLYNDLASQADAKAWLASDATYPFSFLWICEQLALRPDRTRAAIPAITDFSAFMDTDKNQGQRNPMKGRVAA